MPVARKRPHTFPSGLMPVRSKTKISCMVITSCSMPVISEIAVTLRVPSDRRVTWMSRLIVDAIQRIARAVCVNRRQAPVVTGIHRLEHVERFFPSHLADDDAIGPHTQRVDHELTLADCAFVLDIWGPCFEANHVPLAKHQL